MKNIAKVILLVSTLFVIHQVNAKEEYNHYHYFQPHNGSLTQCGLLSAKSKDAFLSRLEFLETRGFVVRGTYIDSTVEGDYPVVALTCPRNRKK